MSNNNKLTRQITGIVFLVIIVGIVLMFMGGNRQNTRKGTTEQVTNKKEKYVTISGIDKDNGELVLQEINVWENAGPQRGRVMGKLPNGTKVSVLEEKTTDQKYYKITTNTLFYEGWVSEQMVQE